MNIYEFTRILQLEGILIVSILYGINADYRVGVGIYDITGPVEKVGFLGYANPFQKGAGLHLRQFARVFIIKEGLQRVLFVSIDCSMVGFAIRKKVLTSLKKIYGTIYDDQNVVISATHTHSASGGYMMDLLYDLSTFGFVDQTFNAIHDGIIKAIRKAHDSIQDAKIFIASGTLLNANVNRSPLSYLLNPEIERNEYDYDVDKELIQLKFIGSQSNRLLGVLNWFPVHPTSMNNTNTLVSSDNVGYASILFETHINNGSLIGKGPFVAAFASTNLGDVSPNIKGPRCIDTGNPCDGVTSTCNGKSQNCIAFGPGEDMFESTKIIAERLFKKSLELFNRNDSREIKGNLEYRHRYVNMSDQIANFTYPNGTIVQVQGCIPALGYSFAAGTTDGAGAFDFTQGTKTSNPLWNIIRDFIAEPTKEDITCHHPKPIFLATGRIKVPYRWQPQIISTQVIILGDVVIAAVPGEFTTMSGRRMKKALVKAITDVQQPPPKSVIIAGLSNTYSSYVATPEEYELQRYEAASTIYGPHTLTIYLNLYSQLIQSLYSDKPIDNGPEPEDISKDVLSFTIPPFFDLPKFGFKFGECIKQPPKFVKRGSTISAVFVSGNARNNLMHNASFLTIEKNQNQRWVTVATDANWETKFRWRKVPNSFFQSEATVEWYVDNRTEIGYYRIRHFGYRKAFYGQVSPYNGTSKVFYVT